MNTDFNVNGFSFNDIPFSSLEGNEQQTAKPIRQDASPSITSSLEGINNAGVSKAGPLPISPRRFSTSVFNGGIGFIKNAPASIFQLLKGQIITAFKNIRPTSSEGIENTYTDFNTLGNEEKKNIALEGSKYAAHLYKGRTDHTATLEPEANSVVAKPMEELKAGLLKMGFKADYKGVYYDTKTGTVLNLSYIKGNSMMKPEIMVCFWGLGNEVWLGNNLFMKNKNKDPNNFVNISKVGVVGHQNRMAAVGDFAGRVQPSGQQAIDIGKLLVEVTKNTTVTPVVLGHSHGGGLAMGAVAATGVKGVFYNSRPLGSGIIDKLKQEGKDVEKNAQNSMAFSVQDDFVTDSKFLNNLASNYERLTGKKKPCSIGKGYRLPRPPHMSKEAVHSLSNTAEILQYLKPI